MLTLQCGLAAAVLTFDILVYAELMLVFMLCFFNLTVNILPYSSSLLTVSFDFLVIFMLGVLCFSFHY